METLYIDVYFLINLTVDMLAVFISVKLLHLKSSIIRILIASLIGAAAAIIDIFIAEYAIFRLINSVLFLFAAAVVSW